MPRDLIASELEQLIARQGPNDSGAVADYIPELSKADAAWFGMSLCTIDGAVYGAGDHDQSFTIQSVSKSFVYALALTAVGPDRLLEHVGVEPSGDAFHSILLDSSNRPHNPMVNSGTITVVSMVSAWSTGERFSRILDILARFAGRRLDVDEAWSNPNVRLEHRNRAIAHLMRTVGVLADEVDLVLDAYFRQCSVLVASRDRPAFCPRVGGGSTPRPGGHTGPGIAVSLTDSDLGRPLGGADLDALQREASIRSVDAGDELWRAGDEAGSMFLVLEGMLIARDGGYRVASFGPGAIVGEKGFLTGEPRSATVLADAPSRLLEITRLEALSSEGRAAIHRTLALVAMGRLAVTNRALAATRS